MLRAVNIRVLLLTRQSTATTSIRWFSDKSDSDSSDDEKKQRKKPQAASRKSTEALNRLNELLNTMTSTKVSENVNIVTAKNKRQKPSPTEKEDESKDLKSVTQIIAKKMGGDEKQTEAELLSALLGTSADSKGNLSDIIGGMKVESDKPKGSRDRYEVAPGRAEIVRKAIASQKRTFEPRKPREKTEQQTIVKFYDGAPLNIFDKASIAADPLTTWSALEKRELKLAVTHPPRNYFEKMILWTEQGKVWKFPIDNEQGMDVEKQTDFTEHVLLEMYIEDWCPKKGPVRRFMELVCVGLSKNNFLSAQEKRDHLNWYRDYFHEKKDLLGDLLTLGHEGDPKTLSDKQIEA